MRCPCEHVKGMIQHTWGDLSLSMNVSGHFTYDTPRHAGYHAGHQEACLAATMASFSSRNSCGVARSRVAMAGSKASLCMHQQSCAQQTAH